MHKSYLPPVNIQSRLLRLAALFLFLQSLALTLAPAVRLRSWDAPYRWDHWLGFGLWLVLMPVVERQLTKRLPDADPYLFPASALLSGWGLLSIWRLTGAFGLRQLIWLVISLILFTLALRYTQILEFLRRYKYVWLFSGLILTALTFLLGANPGGAGPRLWLGCCGVYLQPSEPLKLLLVVYLAAYFAGRIPIRGRFLPLIFPTLLLTGLALVILMIQRDLGTASIFVFLYTSMLYLASGKRSILPVSLFILIGVGLAGYLFVDIIRLRVDAWLDPWADPSGRAYQIVQSLLAVANGGLFGRGPGMGSPWVVPVAHSDFIFTTIAEENGLVGTLALYLLIASLVIRGYWVALHARNHFQRLLAAGLATYLGIQSLLIIGGNLRLLPLTGVTLPFVSYGGSSLLTSYFAILLLLQISNASENDPAPLIQTTPYLSMPVFLCLGLFAAALLNSWWAIWRSDELLARTDNPRRSIADQYVRRGSLIDRQNRPLVNSIGEVGSLTRIYHYPALSPVIGYTHPVYGQTGLELDLDPYLRGLSGNPTLQIWWEHLLHGEPPPGLDVRLSIDLTLQARADELLGAHHGALVLINARTGETLAIASHPTYDANQLDEIGDTLLASEHSPLLNRALQGSYAPGTALAPFLLAQAYEGIGLPGLPTSMLYQNKKGEWLTCARTPGTAERTWATTLAMGCPQPLATLGSALGNAQLGVLMEKLAIRTTVEHPQDVALGQTVSVSPAQMVLAAATLSNHGQAPVLQIAMAVKTPNQGWVILPAGGTPRNIFSPSVADQVGQLLMSNGKPYWETLGKAEDSQHPLSWYLAGTLPDWQGTPLALAVILEENSPQLAQDIGRILMDAALGR